VYRKALLRRHQTVHNGIKEFSCPKCSYETSHKSNLERHCSRVHNIDIALLKINKSKKNLTSETSNCDNQQSSQSSTNFSETDEFSSSQEMVSSQESLCQKFKSSSLENIKNVSLEEPYLEIKSQSIDVNLIKSKSLDDISSKELKTVNKKLRLCLRPYKCLICWLLFESQLEYFEHQLLSDHIIQDKEELEVIHAAAVLTQLRRSANNSFFTYE
jgi:hypothetical protein